MENHRKFFFMYCYYGRTSIHTIYLSSEWAMALHHKNSTWTRNARLMPVVSFSFFFLFLFFLSSNSHFRQLHTPHTSFLYSLQIKFQRANGLGGDIFNPHFTHIYIHVWIIYVRQIKWRTKANEKEKGEHRMKQIKCENQNHKRNSSVSVLVSIPIRIFLFLFILFILHFVNDEMKEIRIVHISLSNISQY